MVPPASVVNIDTGCLLCSRCLSYVGDAVLKTTKDYDGDGDGDGDGVPPSLTSRARTPSMGEQGAEAAVEDEETLQLSDVRDVRLARHCVAIHSSLLAPGTNKNSEDRGKIVIMPLECTLAATLTHLNSVFSATTFYIYVPESNLVDGPNETDEASGVVSSQTVVLLRLLSTDYAVSASTPSATGKCTESDFEEAVKVSYVDGTPHQLATMAHIKVTGRESRVPLQYYEMCELLLLLKERGCSLGSSILKGHRAAYLRRK